MARSKVSQIIRKTAEGVLNLDNDVITMEIEDVGVVKLADIFHLFNEEYVKVNISVVDDGYSADTESGDGTG